MSGIQMAMLGSGTAIINATARLVTAGAVGTATATYRIGSDGTVYEVINAGSPSVLEQWCVPGFQAGNYEVFATLLTGTLTSGTTGAWLSLGTTRDWTLQETISGNTRNCTFSIQFRRTGSTVGLLPTAPTIELEASRF
jgi:hypothetical protein